ncbi:MAG TPA: hypothetical protein VI643_05770 [Planctomycetota bacterium]|nr:hypothetical protein [Planctomycetota bacterium]
MFARGLSGMGLLASALLASALPAFAQNPAQPPPPAKPQPPPEAVTIRKMNSKFEAWYTITEFDRHLGSAQVNIDPYGSGELRDVTYKQQLIFDVAAKESGVPAYRVQKDVDAVLTADFDLKAFEFRFRFLGRHHVAKLDPDQKQVVIEVVGEGIKEKVALSGLDNPFLSPELAVMILAQKGELGKKSLHKVSVVIPEGDQLKVVTIELKVVGEETRRYMNQLQKAIRLSLNDPPSNYNVTDFWVDQTGRILEYVTQSHVRFQIAREAQFTKIDGKVESWYVGAMLIASRETQIGFGHSLLDPKDVSIEYKWEQERKVGILDAVLRENVVVTAQLSKAYEMRSGRYDWRFSHMTREAVYDGRDRRLDYKDSTGQTKTLHLGREDKFFLTVDQALVSLAQSEELLKAGIHDIVVMDPENLGVTRVQFTVRGVVRREYLGDEVVALQIQGIGREERMWDIYVDRYGRPLEISENLGVRFIVVGGEKEAKGALTAPLPPSIVIDPIKSKLTSKTPGEASGPRPFDRRRQDLEAAYIDVRKTQERIQALLEVGQRIIAKRLVPDFRGSIEKFQRSLESVQEFKDELDRDPQIRVWADQVTVWERLIEEKFPVHEAYMEELKAAERQLLDELSKGNAEGVKRVMDKINQLKEKYSQFAEEVQEQAKLILTRAEKLFRDFEARKKMEAMDFDINAIAWERKTAIHPVRIRVDLFGAGVDRTEPVRVVLTRAYAVIDGGIYAEGDKLTKEGIELLVSRIEKDKVTLSFGDLSKDVLLRK